MGYTEDLRRYIGTKPIIMVGAMELGESTEETAKREVLEEVGLTLGKLSLFNVYSGKDLYYKYPDGNEVYNVTVTYLCDEYNGQIVVDKTEGRDAKFFDIRDLPNNISYTVKPIIEEYIKSRNAGDNGGTL